MLENKAFKHTFCWNEDGTSFVIKDTNDFSKTILPRHFKHCNFASFVRQLNKYDFHKVRNVDDSQKIYGKQSWEFIHPKFIRDHKHLLEEIKRKIPINKQKKESDILGETDKDFVLESTNHSITSTTSITRHEMDELKQLTNDLQTQIHQLKQSKVEIEEEMARLKERDHHISSQITRFKKDIDTKDGIIKQILTNIAEKDKENKCTLSPPNQLLLGSYPEITHHSLLRERENTEKLAIKYNRIEESNIYFTEKPLIEIKSEVKELHPLQQQKQQQLHQLQSLQPIPQQPLPRQQSPPQPLQLPQLSQVRNMSKFSLFDDSDTVSAAAAAAAAMNAGSLIGSPLKTGDGLTFVTLGRLSSNMSVRDNKPAIEIMAADQTPTFASNLQRVVAGVKRKSSSSQVSWTVPPRILLVDDDSVYRDLSGKLLKLIGCTIDLAKDGVEALKKMGLEKYDLILMDIVMPKMDGISATRSIRQYDALTPIISMTSNFTDNDIMQYIGSGMTDILPKPFSKRTLYQMLEKYCAHLKSIQREQEVDPNSSDASSNVLNSLNNMELLSLTLADGISTRNSNISTGNNNMKTNNNPINAGNNPISNANNPLNSGNNNGSTDAHFVHSSPNHHGIIHSTAEIDSSTPSFPLSSQLSKPIASSSSSYPINPSQPSNQPFPLAPYPYPITMNSVPTDTVDNNFHVNNGNIPNVTFWPQQQCHQRDPPPAIIPSDEGKFTWAISTSNPDSSNHI
ncbi:hypothetical protein BDB01DRAFT_782963 [Pilobolus umbonatus]|nr:hypothetical protein BDB01DRAFT_782963 [Pilobolus umbonatus]